MTNTFTQTQGTTLLLPTSPDGWPVGSYGTAATAVDEVMMAPVCANPSGRGERVDTLSGLRGLTAGSVGIP